MKTFKQFVTEGENKQVKGGDPCWSGYEMVGKKKKNGKEVPNCVPVKEEIELEEGLAKNIGIGLAAGAIALSAAHNGIQNKRDIKSLETHHAQMVKTDPAKAEQLKKHIDAAKVTQYSAKLNTSTRSHIEQGKKIAESFELEEDWQKVNRQDKTDGLSQKAVNAYRRENPGSKLQTAVTEKNPSGKRAARRKSFCSRMKGMKNRLTSDETARDPDSRINKALRRWNCN